ncbi:hypothetical protein HMPREF1398_00174 [Helicobacter pylori GAM117Ai]|nr:hypothetical protein HMPREF1398_00174 [Helicobacter pylori GAM117Ai]
MVKVELLKHLFFDKLFSGFLGELVACDPLTTTKREGHLSFNP